MISEKQTTKISKFLSLVLRHKPETIGIQLDQNGWTGVDILIEKMNASGIDVDLDILNHVVKTNSKKRFAFDDSKCKIRASQGHSVNIELGIPNLQPPEILFHGTNEKAVDSILASGLKKRNRHHVHLSSDLDTATKVGQRHGKPIVFKVLAEQMYQDGFEFYLSENEVWLTDFVPCGYLEINE